MSKPTGNELVLDDHVVAFIDLLGFNEATQGFGTANGGAVLSLLTRLASLSAEFWHEVTPNNEGESHRIYPAVSAFSDNIVLSYRIKDIKASDDLKPWLLLHSLQLIVSQIAFAASEIGFLVRGGVTLGALYHAQGVVFGPALGEAVSLESKTAVYPRVLISPRLGRFLKLNERIGVSVREDFDGARHINYFTNFIMNVPVGDGAAERVEQRMMAVGALIRAKLEAFVDDEQKRLKWLYLARTLRDELSSMHEMQRKAFKIDLKKLPL